MTRRRGGTIGALVVVAVLAGCGNDDETEATSTTSTTEDAARATACDEAIDGIGVAVDRYLAGYESGGQLVATEPAESGDPADAPAASTSTTTTGDGPLDEEGFQAALADAQGAISRYRCDPAQTRLALEQRLAEMEPEGPLADAVLRQLSVSMLGELPAEPTETVVAPGEDLRDVLARSPDGSTVVLEAGEHRLDHSLVLLAGIELRGAGRDATTIISTAPEAAVLAPTDRRVTIRGMSIRHEGEEPASVLVGGSASSIAVSDVRLTGGRVDADGQGGAGVLLFGGEGESDGRETTLEVTDAELVDNEAAGLVLSGAHRTSVVRADVRGNGQCGICFLGASDGSVEDSTFDGNGVGIAATGTSRPSLLRLTVRGGEVGIQAADEAQPAIQDVTVSASERAAAIYTGTAAGAIEQLSCQDVDFGIVVGPDARPAIGETDCELAATEG